MGSNPAPRGCLAPAPAGNLISEGTLGLLQARDVPGMAGETVDARATVLKSQERGEKKKKGREKSSFILQQAKLSACIVSKKM